MSTLPLPALVALDTARLALLLLATEPRLKGVALAGAAGTGKSNLARGLAALLPGAPFVDLPLGVDEEALLGGLDLDATLKAGRRVIRAGLLARADGGLLAVDGLNLLPDAAANVLLGALETGEVRVERDGLSLRSAARFGLVGAWDPAEGPPRAHLLDRVGLVVLLPPVGEAGARAEIARRHLLPRPDGAWGDEEAMLRDLVATARQILPAVTMTAAQERELLAAASAFGVQGQRADYFAVLAARASAAVALRDEVDREDLELAVRLVIMPRATRRPEAPADDATPPPPAPPETAAGDSAEPGDTGEPEPVEELFEAVACDLPADLGALPFGAARRGRSGSRGSTSGTRGRHVGSVPGDPRGRRVDVIATLRAAARWQRVRPRPANGRRLALAADDVRVRKYRSKAGALFVFAVDASGSMALNRMRQAKGAVHALLQQAYVSRDRVALLSFRGTGAELLLPPTASVELARRAVDLLPTGGGTPVGAALLAALELADRARRRGIHQVVLVLLTDGRANVGVKAERAGVEDELRGIATGVAASGITSLVVDTERNYLSQGTASRLAAWLGGRYLYLPGASGQAIAAAARDAGGAPTPAPARPATR